MHRAAFSGFRTFALTGRAWTISILVFTLSLVPVFVNLVSNTIAFNLKLRIDITLIWQVPFHYHTTGEIVPVAGCVEDDLTPSDVARRCVSYSSQCSVPSSLREVIVVRIPETRQLTM